MMQTLFIAAFLVAASTAAAAPGSLDPSYGTGGLAPVRVGKSRDALHAIAIQADGKVVSVGQATTAPNDGFYRSEAHAYMAITRHLPDGRLDAAFGSGGRVVLGYAVGPRGGARGVVIQGDGKIVVSGLCGSPLSAAPVCLKRLMPDGTADASFVSPPLSAALASRLAVRPDGKLLVAWRDTSNVSNLARFTSDGALDTTFGGGGILALGSLGDPTALAVQPDQKILWLNSQWARRLMPDGSLDTTFGINGVAGSAGGSALALQPDGRIVVAAQATVGVQSTAAVKRLLPAGDFDPSFSTDGIAPVPFPGETGSEAHAVAVQPDGRILLSGVSRQGEARFITAFRVDASGAPDASLGPGGALRMAVARNTFPFETAAPGIVSAGVGGLVIGAHDAGDFELFRVLGDAGLDAAFGTAGRATTDMDIGYGGSPIALRRMDDGRLVPLTSHGVARVLPDGTPDNGFGDRGTIGFLDTLDTLGLADPRDHAVEPGGGTLIAGQRGQFVPYARRLVRLNPDGSIDNGFASAALGGESIELLPDGRIFTADREFQNEPSRLSRMLPGGTPDSAFWTSGVKTLEPLSVTTLARASSGTWVLGGSSGSQFAAARLSEDGLYDSSFGSNGRFIAPAFAETAGAALEVVRTLQLPDARTLLVGMSTHQVDTRTSPACRVGGMFDGYASRLVIVAIDAQGALDAAFGIGGRISTKLGAYETVVRDAILDTSGRILVAGTWQPTGTPGAPDCNYRAFVARFTPRGALDPTFGTGGVAFLPSAMFMASVGGLAGLPGGAIAGVANIDSSLGPLVTFRMEGGGTLPPPGPAGDVDGDSIPDAVEATLGRDPLWRDNDIFTDARLFAMQQYRDFLGREGDAGGVDFWTNQLASGARTRAQMAETFFNSPEFQATGSPMVRLYFAYFLRIPDYGGLLYWMGRFRSGESLEGISTLFANSPEFVATYGALDNAGFVDRVYRNVLGRAPDANGLAYWKGQLDAGMSRGQMMVQFSESPEYRSLIANEVYVTMMYVGMLRRSPDAGGFSYWVSYMDAGNSGLALTGAFVAAAEYRARFLP